MGTALTAPSLAAVSAAPPAPWALILPGGDGVRLRPLTRQIASDERPKQLIHRAGLFIRKRLSESMSVVETSQALCLLA